MDPKTFAQTFGPACQAAMLKNGGFASVRMAQIALESAWGEATPKDYETGQESYNLTGVKGEGPAGSVRAYTHEFVNGEYIKVLDNFRAYHSFEEHIMERDGIFLNWPENYGAYLKAPSPEAACQALQDAPNPYATDPNYASKLIGMMNTYGFKTYDQVDADVDYAFSAGLIAEIYRVAGGADLRPLRFYGNWRPSWSRIVPGRFSNSGYTDLLLYDQQVGNAEFYSTDGTGLVTLLASYPSWRKSWTNIVPGTFSGRGFTDLLLHDAAAGQVELYATDGNGGMELLGHHETWAPCDLIVPVQLDPNGYTALLFYHRETGKAALYKTDGQGHLTLVKEYTWRPTWRHIVAGRFADTAAAALLFYDADAGTVETYSIDTQGQMAPLYQSTAWANGYTHIVPGNFTDSGRADLLCYDQAKGQALFCSPDAGGTLQQVRRYDTWRTTWAQLVPGNFSRTPLSGLLLYDPNGKAGGTEPPPA